MIYVDPANGTDTKACLLNGSTLNLCATVQHALTGLGNSTQILLSNGTHEINSTINISALHSISLTGLGDPSSARVYCQNGSNSGLRFVGVSDLHISNLEFMNCGSLSDSTTPELRDDDSTVQMAQFRVAVLVQNSTNIYIESTAFINNRGVGLALFDTDGDISLLNSNFTGNSVPEEEKSFYNGGGGLYIEHTYCSPGSNRCNYQDNPFSSNSTCHISNCHFTDNHANTLPRTSSTLVQQEKAVSRRLGQGAGISLTLKGFSSRNNITISHCTFTNNSGRYGGAVNVNLQDYAKENQLLFQNCSFHHNHAKDGGGGLFVGVFFYDGDTVVGNHIHLEHTNFTSNTGSYGGGSHFAISQMGSSSSVQNSITFFDCHWNYNSARLGGALLLVPEAWNTFTDGFLPIPVFTACSFSDNLISRTHVPGNSPSLATEGVVYSSTISLNFTDSILFQGNKGTAISIAGGSINILNDTQAIFQANTGTRGGAVALLDFASLRLFPGSEVIFQYNSATEYGGAIYVSSHNDLDFYFSRGCFIRYSDVKEPTSEWKTHIVFRRNYAGRQPPCDPTTQICTYHYSDRAIVEPDGDSKLTKGNSIFAESVQPCKRAADTTGSFKPTDKQIFPTETGVFVFDEYCNVTEDYLCGIGTTPNRLAVGNLNSNRVLAMAPGEKKHLSLEVRDELNHSVYAAVSVYVSTPKGIEPSHYEVDRSSLYVTDDSVQVNGRINETFRLILRTDGTKQVSTTVNALLTSCPPGLVYNDSKSLMFQRCVCSATTADQRFDGITKCSVDGFHGLLNKGYWAGCGEDFHGNGTFLTAECPLGYCRSGETVHSKPFYELPETCEKLDTFLCGPQNRRGSLCGECKANHSVFFHSRRFNCHECGYKYGIVFYILSELAPVTLVFLYIISFNVHLTSGTWNSVILYAQIIDCFQVNSLQLFELPHGLLELTSIYQFIYGWFNFDFLKLDDYLSFCIWDGMTVLDTLAFKYVTTGFAVLLLILFILCFRCQCWSKYESAWKQCQRITGRSRHHQSWIIHGLSAFLVLSYAQCTKVSFQILSHVSLRGKNREVVKKVVFLSGNIEYFGPAHLPYAIPALLVLILTTIPPVILLLYPVKNSIGSHSFDRLQQFCSSDHVKCWSIMSMNRFKPLIDSFQGCFKDKYRFFAGLFFIYRFFMSLSLAFSTNAITMYTTLEILLIAMLALHAWAQPYEQRFHNLLDTFMFANLAIVNTLSIYNFYWVTYSSDTRNLTVPLAFQIILIYLPIVYLLVLIFFLTLTGYSKKARHSLRKLNEYVPLFEATAQDMEEPFTHYRTESIPFDEDHLPYRMFEDQ